jgi:hypothetical protein
VKYLGVIFDQKLLFHSHLQYVIKKGTNAMMALFSNVSDGETGGTGKRRVAIFSGRLVQSDLKLVVRNGHYMWRPTVSPYHPFPRHLRYHMMD